MKGSGLGAIRRNAGDASAETAIRAERAREVLRERLCGGREEAYAYEIRSYIWPYSMVEVVSTYLGRYVSDCELRRPGASCPAQNWRSDRLAQKAHQRQLCTAQN